MGQNYTIDQLRDIITPIAKAHGVSRVSLFGSRARKTERANSDVDLMIEKGRLVSLWDLSHFRLDAEEALHLPVDLVTTQCSDSSFLQTIRQEEVLLYQSAGQENH